MKNYFVDLISRIIQRRIGIWDGKIMFLALVCRNIHCHAERRVKIRGRTALLNRSVPEEVEDEHQYKKKKRARMNCEDKQQEQQARIIEQNLHVVTCSIFRITRYYYWYIQRKKLLQNTTKDHPSGCLRSQHEQKEESH